MLNVSAKVTIESSHIVLRNRVFHHHSLFLYHMNHYQFNSCFTPGTPIVIDTSFNHMLHACAKFHAPLFPSISIYAVQMPKTIR